MSVAFYVRFPVGLESSTSSRLLWAAHRCSWLLLATPGCSWLLPAAPGCSWLLLAAPGCSIHVLTYAYRIKQPFMYELCRLTPTPSPPLTKCILICIMTSSRKVKLLCMCSDGEVSHSFVFTWIVFYIKKYCELGSPNSTNV